MAFSVKIDVDSDISFGKIKVKLYFIPIYVKKMRFDKLQDVMNGVPVDMEKDDKGKKNDKKPSKLKNAIKKFLIGVVLRIAKRVIVREFDLQSTVGTGDAAATAVAVSTALVAYCQACAYLNVGIKDGVIVPDYERARLFVRFYGIISLCFADIIYAVLSQILSKFVRHGKEKVYGKYAVTD